MNTIHVPIIKRILPQKTYNFLKIIFCFFSIVCGNIYFAFLQRRYSNIAARLKEKDKIKVAFFLIHEAVWKYERLYKLLERDERFDPVVVVCPYVVYGEENMLKEMDQAYNAFLKRGYNVVRTFDMTTKVWLDVKRDIKPDIVFFTNPHKLTRNEYTVSNFLTSLTCYVPYTFQTTFHYNQNYNGFFHNALWKAYYPTVIHHNMSLKYAQNKGRNVVVTGYPGIDRFLIYSESVKAIGKIKVKKNIIWAPHHTINGAGMDLNFSNFLRYHNFMIQVAKEYKDEIFITFKPHPALRSKLKRNIEWGKEKTDAYFQFWKENDFCGFNEGDYSVLFEESDALIHDCDSFMGEYLALNKPVLYTRTDDNVKDRMNEFGKLANEMHYQAANEEEILKFITDVVINGVDTMKEKRAEWIANYITPPGPKEASVNIYNDLKKSLIIDQKDA